jgi:beta-lactamase regulating signal transducer with metallopeptidase domain
MEALVHAMLSNALVATALALLPLVLGRFGRSPALVHSLWLVVLLKLVTPPIVTIPLAFDPLSAATPSPAAQPVAAEADHKLKEDLAEGTACENQAIGEPTRWDRDDRDVRPTDPAGLAEGGDGRGGLRFADPPYEEGYETARPIEAHLPAIPRLTIPRWEVLFLVLIVTGGLACWSLAAVRIIRLRRLLREIRPAPADAQERVAAVAQQLGLGRAPMIWLAPGRIPPMLWALGGRARLLVPSELWASLAEDERTTLLAHELAHLKRKDHWVRWLDLAVAGLYWWHPVLWWARSGLREAEEQCCDAWVVWAMPRGSRTYAAALLAALEFVSGAPTAGVAAAAAVVSGRRHVSCLKRRMRMIVRAKTSKGLSWAGRIGVLGLTALILPLAPTWAQKPTTTNPGSPRDPSAASPTDRSASDIIALNATLAAMQEQAQQEADRSDEGESRKDAADKLETRLKDLGDKLAKDLGPVGEEIRKALEKAATEVNETLKREGLSGEEMRKALERAREDLRQAFEDGGPVNREAREALEKARKDMRESVDRAREELHQAMRDRIDEAQESVLQDEQDKDRAAEGGPQAEEVAKARREVREMEQQLRRAMRRLEALERREGRLSRDLRRGREAAPARPPVPPHPPAAPHAAPAPHPAPAPRAPESRPAPPSPPETPTTPEEPGRFQGPGAGPGPRRGPGGPPVANPRVERRLRDLEEKMDRLLKELQELKGEKKDKPAGETRRQEPRGRTRRVEPGERRAEIAIGPDTD